MKHLAPVLESDVCHKQRYCQGKRHEKLDLIVITDASVKSPKRVIPAKAVTHKYMIRLDPRLRGDDKQGQNETFYILIIIKLTTGQFRVLV